MAMHRFSNTVFLNFFTLLASISIMTGGLWMEKSPTNCQTLLQMPLLVVGFVIFIISLAGFIGARFNKPWAPWVYLVIMLFLIAALLGFIVFGFVVARHGGGVEVPGRVYMEYHLEDYSDWLKKIVKDPQYWLNIKRCILGSRTCEKIVLWIPIDYLVRDMSPVQFDCKLPSSCNYAKEMTTTQDEDCYKWNNASKTLCYECDSCKAGVLETATMDGHKLSILNVVMAVLLIGIYSIGCCAFQNSKRAQTDNPFGKIQCTKSS